MYNHFCLNESISYVGLGDRLDAIAVAKLMYDKNQQHVVMYQFRGEFKDFSPLTSLYDMKVTIEYPRMPDLRFGTYFKHDAKGFDQISLLKSVDDYSKINVPDQNIDLPNKFVTVQFDGNQSSRTGCSAKEVDRIKSFYTKQGYELVPIGAEATDPLLEGKTSNLLNIAYAMKKADLHVGIDSGMMNFAKIVIPCDKIHIYTSDTNDFKSSLLKRCKDKGTKVNYSRKKV